MSDTQSKPYRAPCTIHPIEGKNGTLTVSSGDGGPAYRIAYVPNENDELSEEQQRFHARIIAAAGTAAHELPSEYDPVAAVEQLTELLQIFKQLQTWQSLNGTKPTLADIHDALDAARGD